MEKLNNLFTIGTKWALYASLIFYMFFLAAPSAILTLVFGESYAGGATVLIILSTANLIVAASGFVGSVLVMTHNQNIWLRLSAMTIVINAALNYLLIPRYGIEGASIATGFSMSLVFVSGLVVVKRKLGLFPYDRRYLKGLVATVTTAAALFGWNRLAPDNDLIIVLVNGIISFSVFTITLYFMKFDFEEINTIRGVRRRIRRMSKPAASAHKVEDSVVEDN